MSLTSSITSAIEERRVQRERLDVEIQKLEQMLELSTDLEGTEPPAATPAPVPAVSKSKAAKKPAVSPPPAKVPAGTGRSKEDVAVVLDAITQSQPIAQAVLAEMLRHDDIDLAHALSELQSSGRAHRTADGWRV